MFRLGFQVNPDISLLEYSDDRKQCEPCSDEESHQVFYTKQARKSDKLQLSVLECRTCKDCNNHERTEALSFREELEQYVIDDSVIVDILNRETIASLPL